MSPALILLIIVVGIGGLVFLWGLAAYNGLVQARNEVRNSWSQIDVQLKRRHDLVPNLVETVKGYAGHERSTLESVVQARAAAVAANGVQEQARAEGLLSGALGRLMAVVEQYPDLKANRNFLALQEELTSTENKIGFARQYFNDTVMKYNTRLEQAPTNIVAGLFRFQPGTFFEIDNQAAREAPQVKFS